MQKIQIPNTDLTVSRLCFGCWGIISDQHWGQRDEAQARATILAALALGVNFFDTAAMYGAGESEKLLGRVLSDRRKEVVIATKLSPSEMSADQIPAACERALENLQTDYIDLLQTHWTSRETPLAETWSAMRKLQQQGKVRHLGVCNMGSGDLQEVVPLGKPITNQLPYNLLWRQIEPEIVPACRQNGIGILAYSPLMHGLLADKYHTADEVPEGRARSRHFGAQRTLVRHGEPGCESETFAALDAIREICKSLGRSMADVALAWCLQQPGVTSVIAGAASPEQVCQNLASVEFPLSEQALADLERATRPLAEALGPNPDMWQNTANSRFR